MEVILALSAIAGLYAAWFWAVFVVATAFLFGFIANERGGLSTLFTIVVGALVVIKAPQVLDVLSNPVLVLGSLAGYLAIGVVWSRIKWGRFLTAAFDLAVDVRARFIKKKEWTGIDQFKEMVEHQGLLDEYKDALVRGIGRVYNHTLMGCKTLAEVNAALAPVAKENKGSIVMWIAYWPLSILIYLLRDLLADIGKWLYELVGGYFQAASDAKFKEL